MLEGEKAARSLAATRLREAEKAAAALEAPDLAAALSPAPANLTPPPPPAGGALAAQRAALQEEVDRRSEQVELISYAVYDTLLEAEGKVGVKADSS